VALGNPFLHADLLREKWVMQPFDLVVPTGEAYWLVCPQITADRPGIRLFRE
jgi:hypothetical protein